MALTRHLALTKGVASTSRQMRVRANSFLYSFGRGMSSIKVMFARSGASEGPKYGDR